MLRETSRTSAIALVLSIGVLGIAACNPSANEVRQLRSENEALRRELQATKAELEELKYGPDRLLGQAQSKLDAGNPADAKAALIALLQKHPNSPEAAKAKALAAEVNAVIARQEQEARQQAEHAAAERRRQEAEDTRRIAVATSKMRTKFDEIEKITWYTDKTTPRFTNYNSFHLYFGKQTNGLPWLRFRIQYNADDWLFIHYFLVVADGQRFERPMVDFERDSGSEIWEWYDESPSADDIEMVKAVIGSKKAVIRFTGRQYHKDRTITQAEKQALQNVLDAYVALGGRLP